MKQVGAGAHRTVERERVRERKRYNLQSRSKSEIGSESIIAGCKRNMDILVYRIRHSHNLSGLGARDLGA